MGLNVASPSLRLAPWAILVVFVVGLLAATAQSADAHVQLIASSPAHGETLAASPTELVLTFDAPVQLPPRGGLRLWVDGREVALSPAVGPTGSELWASLPPDVASGSHHVMWRIVTADSHVEEGSFSYVVRVATDGAIVPIAATSADADPHPGHAMADSAEGASSGSLMLALGVIAMAGVVAVVILRGGRRAHPS